MFALRSSLSWIGFGLLLLSCTTDKQDPPNGKNPPVQKPDDFVITAGKPVEDMPNEKFFKNVRQLTFGGKGDVPPVENAEAYWSGDGTRLILQSKRPPYRADQIFILDLATGKETVVSTGKGVCTCSYFLQGDKRIIYASTHLASAEPPPPTMFVRDEKGRRAYVWPLHKGYDIFTADPDGKNVVRLTKADRYDAEATVCPVTGRVVFTSLRDGDMELYSMEPDGSDVKRLTNREGLDGGAFFSHDGTKLVQRSSFPTGDQLERYRKFTKRDLMVPKALEITVLDRDGKNFRKVTNNGKANFGPYWHPDNKRIIFSSNQDSKSGRDFELYIINEDGKGQQRVTVNPTAFDGFPMFSPNGKYIVFASNRFNPKGRERDTNIFVAEWVEPK